MLKLRTALVYFSLLLFAVLIHAQGAVQASLQAGQGLGVGSASGNGTARVEVGMVGVPGQPLSADIIEETDKSLADGNHIHRETHGRMFFDSEGRTRSEMEIQQFGPGSKPMLHILIIDRAEKRTIILDPEHKTATITHFAESANSEVRVLSRSVARPAGAIFTNPAPSALAPVPPMLGLPPSPGQIHAGMGERSTENLGTKTIENFTVTGTRDTFTMAAGTMGNDRPIITTSEHWWSADLKMDLLTIFESPESGKYVRKIVNIRTGNPDPQVFQVPADFTVREMPQL